jgi:hypothetical protein
VAGNAKFCISKPPQDDFTVTVGTCHLNVGGMIVRADKIANLQTTFINTTKHPMSVVADGEYDTPLVLEPGAEYIFNHQSFRDDPWERVMREDAALTPSEPSAGLAVSDPSDE